MINLLETKYHRKVNPGDNNLTDSLQDTLNSRHIKPRSKKWSWVTLIVFVLSEFASFLFQWEDSSTNMIRLIDNNITNRMQCPIHIKKLEKITSGDHKCEVCGRKATLECRSCEFKQCSDCRICSERHHLIKIIDLNVPQPSLRKSKVSTTVMPMPAIVAPKAKL